MDVLEKEEELLMDIYLICDGMRDDDKPINDGASFIIRALSQKLSNFYIKEFPDINTEIEVLKSTKEELELDEDYELCAVYLGAIENLKRWQKNTITEEAIKGL